MPITVSFDKDLKDLVDLAPSTEQLALSIQALRNTQSILGILSDQETKMSAELETLTAQVAANTNVLESAVTLIGGFKQRLDDAVTAAQGGDLQKLSDLQTELATEDAKLAAAVAANTPAAPAPTPAATSAPAASTADAGTTAVPAAAPADAPAAT